MRYAEIENGRVRYVLPAELAGEYQILPPNAVEIALKADVTEGMVYENGEFREYAPPELTPEEARVQFDAARNGLFSETEWVRQRHADRVELGIEDGANWTAWLEYWQELRDMPEGVGFDVAHPVWPTPPE